MKILLTSPDQSTLTGQPMYVKNLAKGLRELKHDVTCSENPSGDYDIAIINDNFPQALGKFTAKKIYNFCHSKNSCDEPLIDKRITGYLAPRDEVANHWKSKYNIDFKILEIPIDFKRFSGKRQTNKYTILAPCTFEPLRIPMIMSLIERAKTSDIQLIFRGDDRGVSQFNKYPNIIFKPQTQTIEEDMKDADEVAGIFIGTVTLEAWAMGLKTSVYDEKGNWEYIEKPKDFEKYNYLNVARKLLEI
jgi:hypothetical protein